MNLTRSTARSRARARLRFAVAPCLLLAALSACRSEPVQSLVVAAPPIAAPPLAAPVTSRERSTREITVKSELAYLLTLPRGYVDAGVAGAPRWPLVVFLHGMGERGSDLAMVARHGPPKLIAAGREFPAIVVSPQCPLQPQFGWSTTAVLALLEDVCERYAVDASRVYLTGLSMGGYGTWAIACEQPQRFAAIAPICGGGDPAKAAALVGLPTWVFHGGADPVVPLAQSESMVKAIEAAGGHPKVTVYDGVGHDSWSAAYDDAAFWEWLFEQRREAR
ncbi:MAG: prolyl oligopeptidase family serine peptidase [Planctomycetes bacterium]|nr:prolyl oligopeptidase family serine peptidase [Planctomycetota bacterium]